MGGRTDITKLKVPVHNFANAPKKERKYAVKELEIWPACGFVLRE
jgi:hypothetical protein